MGRFDAIRHRGDRRAAAELYAQRLVRLTPSSTRDEARDAQLRAAGEAGEHLAERDRDREDEALRTRLSLEASNGYGDELVWLDIDAVLDGSWREKLVELGAKWAPWLLDEHRTDQHWQAGEAMLHAALEGGHAGDAQMSALEQFLAQIDPDGPRTSNDPWFARFAAARLANGLLPQPRNTPRLITQAGETIVLSEPGEIAETVEWLDGQDRLRERVELVPVLIDASDRRIAVFADELLFSVLWTDVVGASAGSDDHGTFLRLDDAGASTSRIIHSPIAGLLATIARELHRRSGS